MRYAKGKWVASVKDTYSVDTTLDKIVYAHISKLYDCLSKSECAGVPMYYVELQAALDGIEDKWEGDVDKAHVLRMKDLEELLWVFGSSEPDMDQYAFHIEMVSGERKDNGNTPVTFVTTGVNGSDGKSEKNRYYEDCRAYEKRKQAGYVLFGQIYQYLSW